MSYALNIPLATTWQTDKVQVVAETDGRVYVILAHDIDCVLACAGLHRCAKIPIALTLQYHSVEAGCADWSICCCLEMSILKVSGIVRYHSRK